jgi:hypothetical protein
MARKEVAVKRRGTSRIRGCQWGTNASRILSSLHLVRFRNRVEKLTGTVFLRSPFRNALR